MLRAGRGRGRGRDCGKKRGRIRIGRGRRIERGRTLEERVVIDRQGEQQEDRVAAATAGCGNTVLHCTVLHCTALHCTLLFWIGLD